MYRGCMTTSTFATVGNPDFGPDVPAEVYVSQLETKLLELAGEEWTNRRQETPATVAKRKNQIRKVVKSNKAQHKS